MFNFEFIYFFTPSFLHAGERDVERSDDRVSKLCEMELTGTKNMLNKTWLIVVCILLCFPFYSFNYSNSPQENQPPVVKIISPQNNTTFDPNSPITYKITIS